MKLLIPRPSNSKRSAKTAQSAFSLMELLVAVGIMGVMFVSLYAGLSSGFAVIQLARENLRAGQILQEKMETIRLYTWTQINDPSFIPTNFLENFYTGTQSTGGLVYTGMVTIAASPVTSSYSNDLKMVSVKVNWKSAGVLRERQMSTLVSQYGLHKYIY